ncbi:hypothetical protein KL930_000940 [Ogataea haglerorum]|uniref:Uncharacterized protein n=1 Tax=Ogataea haglerorum TaxID=1937702 RepID=A0AAN6DAP4_9ASCO|nr:hypothetical protein KL915_000941 [Ogataea haglerorum]KAG7701910.1 hypothetical protein KL951_000366 [Ogataea haglerorum]KAG7711723.1 hypothetical protein KL914_000365 [Ogataea haglerorum]KAG7712496.1 hypothetical protein KL950_000367 [Ogataea haglerorum]KAG7722547.1 hypothetical protein KL913_000367 [Ogataea haglerorum]
MSVVDTRGPFYLYKFGDKAEKQMDEFKVFPTPEPYLTRPSDPYYTPYYTYTANANSALLSPSSSSNESEIESTASADSRETSTSRASHHSHDSDLDCHKFKCTYPGCKYKGTFLSKDYLRRHIREQHRKTKLHACEGRNKDDTVWGCSKKFSRPYQLINHWRGQRSLKKCGVPAEELMRYGII